MLDALEGGNLWNNNLKEERRIIKAKLQEILAREERVVCLKNKFAWARDADANTNLFHLLMSARRTKEFYVEDLKRKWSRHKGEGRNYGRSHEFL